MTRCGFFYSPAQDIVLDSSYLLQLLVQDTRRLKARQVPLFPARRILCLPLLRFLLSLCLGNPGPFGHTDSFHVTRYPSPPSGDTRAGLPDRVSGQARSPAPLGTGLFQSSHFRFNSSPLSKPQTTIRKKSPPARSPPHPGRFPSSRPILR